jgi:hypothetical protein
MGHRMIANKRPKHTSDQAHFFYLLAFLFFFWQNKLDFVRNCLFLKQSSLMKSYLSVLWSSVDYSGGAWSSAEER